MMNGKNLYKIRWLTLHARAEHEPENFFKIKPCNLRSYVGCHVFSNPDYQALIAQVNQSHGKELLSGRILLMAYADNQVSDIEERLSIIDIEGQLVLPSDARDIDAVVNEAMPNITDMYFTALVMSGHIRDKDLDKKPEAAPAPQ